MSLIIGVDPGISGAYAVVDYGKLVLASEFPLLEREAKARGSKKGTRTERYYDLSALRQIWRRYQTASICIEWVSSMPRDGSTQAFKFGDCFGQLKGLATGLGMAVELVKPRVWQKYHCFDELPKDMSSKEKSRLLCKVVGAAYENRNGNIPDGIADAILIAFYGARRELLL